MFKQICEWQDLVGERISNVHPRQAEGGTEVVLVFEDAFAVVEADYELEYGSGMVLSVEPELVQERDKWVEDNRELALNLGILSEEEFDTRRKADLKVLVERIRTSEAAAKESRRAQYEILKKEFDDE